MPSAQGDVCSLRLDTLGWTPGTISGVIVSECADDLEERVSLPVSSGHHSHSVDAVLPATVTGVTGTVSVGAGSASTSATFVKDGETSFTLPVAAGKTVHEIAIEARCRRHCRWYSHPWCGLPTTRTGRRAAPRR